MNTPHSDHSVNEKGADRLLTEKEVALIIGMSVAWLQKGRSQGYGPPFKKIGRSVRYSLLEVLKWLASNESMRSTSDPSYRGGMVHVPGVGREQLELPMRNGTGSKRPRRRQRTPLDPSV